MSKFKLKGPSLYPNIMRSSSGYRVNSDARDEESLIVPSNKISMKEDCGCPLEKGKIKGTGLTTGASIIMEPGKEYEFPGDEEVLEEPV
jgi:hypothetical protein